MGLPLPIATPSQKRTEKKSKLLHQFLHISFTLSKTQPSGENSTLQEANCVSENAVQTMHTCEWTHAYTKTQENMVTLFL